MLSCAPGQPRACSRATWSTLQGARARAETPDNRPPKIDTKSHFTSRITPTVKNPQDKSSGNYTGNTKSCSRNVLPGNLKRDPGNATLGSPATSSVLPGDRECAPRPPAECLDREHARAQAPRATDPKNLYKITLHISHNALQSRTLKINLLGTILVILSRAPETCSRAT